jgi:uncharacterized protein (UPF0297 family)
MIHETVVYGLFRFGGRGSDSMQKLNNTQYFKVHKDTEVVVSDVIRTVYSALTEKGYNPLNQIVGYVMSGDPTYITSHKGARSLIMKVERDEIVEELLRFYIEKDINQHGTR